VALDSDLKIKINLKLLKILSVEYNGKRYKLNKVASGFFKSIVLYYYKTNHPDAEKILRIFLYYYDIRMSVAFPIKDDKELYSMIDLFLEQI